VGNFIDFSFDAATFATLILSRLRLQTIYSQQIFDFPKNDPDTGETSVEVLLDHVEFPDDPAPTLNVTLATQTQTFSVLTLTSTPADQDDELELGPGGQKPDADEPSGGTTTDAHYEPTEVTLSVPEIIAKVSVKLFLKEVSVAQDPDQAPDTYISTPSGTLLIRLSATHGAVCARLIGYEGAGLEFLASLIPEIQNIIDSQEEYCAAINLGALSQLIGSAETTNVALAAVADSTGLVETLGLRIELNGPSTTSGDWQEYISSFDESFESPTRWSLVIAKELIEAALVRRFEALDVEHDQFKIDSLVDLSWRFPGAYGGGGAVATFSGHIENIPCPNDIGVDPITLTLDFKLEGSSLVGYGEADWNVVDSDVALCAVVYGPAAGSLVSEIVFGVVAGVLSGNQSLADEAVFPPECVATGERTFTCTFPFELEPLDFGGGARLTLTPTSLVGSPTGAKITGTSTGVLYGAPQLYLTNVPDEDTIPFSLVGECFTYTMGYNLAVELDGGGGAAVCLFSSWDELEPGVQILDDPENVFGTFTIKPWSQLPWLPLTIEFTLNPLPQDHPYWDDPYQPTLYIRSSASSHSIRLPALAKPSDVSLDPLRSPILKANILCRKQADGWLGIPGRYDPHWSVDPGPDDVIDVIDVIGVGERAGTPLESHEVEGGLIATATTSPNGRAELSTARVGAGGRPAYFVRRAAASIDRESAHTHLTLAHEPGRRALSALQRRLRRVARINAPERITDLHVGRLRGETVALIATRHHLRAHSLDRNGALLGHFRLPARAWGAIPRHGRLLAWGPSGLAFDGRRVSREPISQLVTHALHLYALVPGKGLVIYDPELRRIARVPLSVESDATLMMLGSTLAIARSESIELYDVRDPKRARSSGTIARRGARTVSAIDQPSGTRALLIDRDTTFDVYTPAQPSAPVASYVTRPWFSGAVEFGGRIVRVDPAGHHIDVYTTRVLGRTCLRHEPEP
jgi:hypothetical protein